MQEERRSERAVQQSLCLLLCNVVVVGAHFPQEQRQYQHATWTAVGTDDDARRARAYREFHLLANLGWVDLDLGSSPGWWAVLYLATAQAGWWNIPNLSQPNPGSPADEIPCTYVS